MKALKSTYFFYPFVIAGITLAIYQLLFNRSLWLDEAMLSRNIVEKSFIELLQPLNYNQVAPIGFLWIEKFFTLLIGNSEYGLRIFPFLCFIATIPFLYFLTYTLTKKELAAWLATAFFACSISVTINYSSEVKQYMCDVFCTVMILLVTVSFKQNSTKSLLTMAFTGIIAILLSNISILFLFTCGLYLFYKEVYKKKNYRLLMILVLWGLSFCIYYFLFIFHHPTERVMLNFWKDVKAFAPFNIFSAEFWTFIREALINIFRDLFGFDRYWIYASAATGISMLYLFIKKRFDVLLLLILPISCHLLLSMFSLYPFFGRLVLYSLPLLAIILAIGFTSLYEILQSRFKKTPAILLCIPLLPVCNYIFEGRFPLEKEEIKHSIEYVDHHIRGEQIIYLYSGAVHAYTFYQKTGVVKNKQPLVTGVNRKKNQEQFLSQLNNFSGETWLIFSHVKSYDSSRDEEKYIIDRLIERNGKLIDSQKYTGSSVYLIQMN